MRGRREHRPAVGQLNVYRVIRCGSHELRLGGPSLLLELIGIPSTGDNEPGTGRFRVSGVSYAGERLGQRRGTDPIHFRAEARAGADRVQVRINQAWNDRSSL